MTTILDDAASDLQAWCHGRDAEAFQRLCERHVGLVTAACRRQGSPDVEEAVQAVFLVLARRAASVSPSTLGGWLTITARRVVRDQRRAATRRRLHEQQAAYETTHQHSTSDDPATSEPDWCEVRQQLDAALASLSPARREAVVRFYLEGKPQAQIASELGCSVDAVKTRVHESLARLRSFFARRGLAINSVALAAGLTREATASDPSLVAACTHSALTPAVAPGAAALAHGVVTAMVIKTAALTATGLLLVGSSLFVVSTTSAATAPAGVSAPAPDTREALISELVTLTKSDESLVHLLADQVKMRNPVLAWDGQTTEQALESARKIVARSEAIGSMLRKTMQDFTLEELRGYRDFLRTPAGAKFATVYFEAGIDMKLKTQVFTGVQRASLAALGRLHSRDFKVMPTDNTKPSLRRMAQEVLTDYGYDDAIALMIVSTLVAQGPANTTQAEAVAAMKAAFADDPNWKKPVTAKVLASLDAAALTQISAWLRSPLGVAVVTKTVAKTADFIRDIAAVLTASAAAPTAAPGQDQQPPAGEAPVLTQVEAEFKRLRAASQPKEF